MICAFISCYNKASYHVGLFSKVRLICISCFKDKFRKCKEDDLKKYNPQETLFKTEKQKETNRILEVKQ